jgi:hypothetical protein
MAKVVLLPDVLEQERELEEDVDEGVPTSIKNSLLSLMKKFGTREMFPRLLEIADAQKQRFYSRGMQHLSWNGQQKSYQVNGLGGPNLPYESNAAQQSTSLRSFNLYLGNQKSFMAVMTQSEPTTRMKPDDTNSAVDISTAAEAEKLKRLNQFSIKSKLLRLEISRYLWTDRRVLCHTFHDGTKEQTVAYGVLESKVPIASKTMEQWPYCMISTEKDLCLLKEENSDQAEEIKSGVTGAGIEQVARSARVSCAEGTPMYQQSGDTLSFMGTETLCWFRPSAYRELSDEDADELRGLYPEGVYCKFVGDALLGKPKPESMDDHLTVMHGLPGDGQSFISCGDPLLPVQDVFNEMMNLVIDAFRYVIPATWVDEEMVDIDAIQQQIAQYGAHYGCERKGQQPVAEGFYTEPAVNLPDGLFEFLKELQGPLAQFLATQPPALWGGNMPDQKTASGYAQARAQAMGVMGIIWLPFTQFWADIIEQQILSAAENAGENAVRSGEVPSEDGQSEEILIVDLKELKGNFHCEPEVSEDFPETYSQKSAKFMQMVEVAATNPVVAAVLGDPNNLSEAKDLLGLEDFVIPGKNFRDRVISDIAELLKVTPVPDEQATQANQRQADAIVSQQGGKPGVPVPPVMKSSITVNSAYVNGTPKAAIGWAVVGEWIDTPEGRKAEKNNPDGFQNVELYGLQYKAMIPPPPVSPLVAPHQAQAAPAGAQ